MTKDILTLKNNTIKSLKQRKKIYDTKEKLEEIKKQKEKKKLANRISGYKKQLTNCLATFVLNKLKNKKVEDDFIYLSLSSFEIESFLDKKTENICKKENKNSIPEIETYEICKEVRKILEPEILTKLEPISHYSCHMSVSVRL